MPYFRVNIRFNQQNLGSAVNVFAFEDPLGGQTDTVLLNRITDWIEAIYTPLRPFMDVGCSFASGQVVETDNLGEAIRVVGSITPVIGGTLSGDQLTLVAAGSAFARTSVPKVRGSKRFPGISESVQEDGLFSNALVNAMVQAVFAWVNEFDVANPLAFAIPGVFSSKALDFVRFAGQAVITNIPGTQVTRKPLRGQ